MWSGHSCPLRLTLSDEVATSSRDSTNGKGTTSVVPLSTTQTNPSLAGENCR